MTHTDDKLVVEQRGKWFERNADSRNPGAFINTAPHYFASECAAAIMSGTLVARFERTLPYVEQVEVLREALIAARGVLHDALMPDGIYASEAEPALAKIDAALSSLPEGSE